MKKFIVFILPLAFLICGSLFANGKQESAATGAGKSSSKDILNSTGFPIVKQPVTLKMVANKPAHHGPWDQMLVWKVYEQKTGIHVDFEEVPNTNFAEKFNLIMASNELPDAFIDGGIGASDLAKYGPSGSFVAINHYLDEYGPNLKALFAKYPATVKNVTAPDGNIYAYPLIVTLNAALTGLKFWVNDVWLKELGLKLPETTDELYRLLQGFKQAHPDAIMFSSRTSDNLVRSFAGSFGLDWQMGGPILIDNGKVQFWYGDQRYKRLLEYLHKLYSEGLIDPEIFTQNQAIWLSKLDSSRIGVFQIQTDNTWKKPGHEHDFVGIANPAGPDGARLITPVGPITRGLATFVVTSADKYPAATIRWVDYFYSREGSIFLRMGVEGETFEYKKSGNYKMDYVDSIKNDPRGEAIAIGQFTIWPGGGAPHWINDENSVAINSPITQAVQDLMNPYMPKNVYGPPILDFQTQQAISTIESDIDSYYAESRDKFITGRMSFDQWDEYVQTLNKMGLSKLQAAYQAAFDR